jgi:hypothetical protein
VKEFESQCDESHVICPYCLEKYQPDAETYSEDTRVDDCPECGKKFHLYQSFTVEHHTKPDCELNGAQHAWSPHKLTGGRTHDFCDVCGKCRPYERAAVTG